MGHIYIGTLGTPGAYHAMRHGTVDEEWAREHHELWYNEIAGGGYDTPPPPLSTDPVHSR
jgi:formate dehydrogenase subunit gamma